MNYRPASLRTLPPPHARATATPLRSVEEVAPVLGVSTKTVRRLIDRGDLLAHRVGRCIRVSDADLRSYLASTRGG